MSHDGLHREAGSETPDLRFHIKHSPCLKLSEDGSSVVRWEAAKDGTVFSDRPISINDRVSFRISQIDPSILGSLLIGMTTHGPESARAFQLMNQRNPTLSRSSMEKEGYVMKLVPKQHLLHGGNILSFLFSAEGVLHYFLNGVYKGIFLSGIDTSNPLWLMCYLTHRVQGIEVVPSPSSTLQLTPVVAQHNSFTSPTNHSSRYSEFRSSACKTEDEPISEVDRLEGKIENVVDQLKETRIERKKDSRRDKTLDLDTVPPIDEKNSEDANEKSDREKSSTDESKKIPEYDDVNARLETDLPSSSVSREGVARKNRAKSSSSERRALGFRGLPILPMDHTRPLMSSKDDDEESTTSSHEEKEDGGCCDVEPVRKWNNGKKTLPEHKEEFIDSHCHLDFIWGKQPFHDMDELRRKFFFPKTFKGCIANFIQPDLWEHEDWIKTVVKDRQVLGTSWGIHPHSSGNQDETSMQFIRKYIIENREELKIVAIGECGLDQSGRNQIPFAKQLEVFKFQVELAYELDLPIIIHCREGPGKDPEDEVLKVLQQRPYHSIHRHCFTRDSIVAQKWMKTLHNCTFGFTPLVTHSEWFVPLLQCIPLDRIHLETDAPYFRVQQYEEFTRPTQCSLPGAAVTVAVRISEISGLSVDEVIRATRMCTNRIYRLPN